MGGRVGPGTAPEVGIMQVDLTDAGKTDPLFAGLSSPAQCLQWHGAAVLEAPPGATVLASSPVCPVQAIHVGDCAYGLQYHVEATADTVPEWGCVPEYEASLEAAMGEGALRRFEDATAQALPTLNAAARTLYDNFAGIVRASAAEPERAG
jgi:GMP synthase-like glutamine amidotransferase